MLSPNALKYLTDEGLTENTASESALSKAKAYSSCYDWYIANQSVTASTAELASKVWVSKYALHNDLGICLESTPEDMWHRIARTLAEEELKTNKDSTESLETWESKFYNLLTSWKYTPGGSGLFVLGNPYVKSSASNCFVWDGAIHGDSLEGIMETAKNMATIFKYRGGCGVDLSHLRPANTTVSNAARTSSGAASFMDFFSTVTAVVGQSGRRGASMESIRVDHPDIFRFISEKQDLDKQWFFDELAETGININDFKYFTIAQRLKSTSNANISVKLTDKFIKAVEDDSDFELWYEFENNKYPRISSTVKARAIWDSLITAACNSGEPGMFNWDLLLRESVTDCYASKTRHNIVLDGVNEEVTYVSRTISTNPCGELPLSHGDSCCIGSFYLPAFVLNPWTNKASFDFDSFISSVRLGTRAQDNIKNIDLDKVPLKDNKIAGILLRRIGLGCHGLSDMLASIGLKYDTDSAIEFSAKVYEVLKNTVYDESVTLGIQKGVAPIWNWDLEKSNPFLNRLDAKVLNRIQQHGRRNIACLTNAPTGSLSILSRNCSSGIEPVFKKSYDRTVKLAGSTDAVKYKLYHQAVQDCMDAGGDTSLFVEANDVNPHKKIDLQAALQKHIDHSISVTTNLPAGTPKETVSKLYLEAFNKGCKGFTVYVDGSRSGILGSSEEPKKMKPRKSGYTDRPKTTDIDIFKTKYKDNIYMILIGKLPDGTPIECFGGLEDGVSLPTKYEKAQLVKKSRGHYTLNVQLSEDPEDVMKVNNISNRFPAGDIITITRMISLALRNNVPVGDIVDQLTRSASSLYDAPAVFARVLKNYITDEEVISKEKAKGETCPDCGSELDIRRESGCIAKYCTKCSYFNSKCS